MTHRYTFLHATSAAVCSHMRSAMGVLSCLLGLGTAQPALADPLILIFDEFLHGPVLSNQSQGGGETTAGVPTTNVVTTPGPAQAGVNVAFAPTGLLVFTLNTSITGTTQANSADILRAQVSTSAPLTLEAFRLGSR